MLRQAFNIFYTGGFKRLLAVQMRVAETFSAQDLDKLMKDDIVRPKNTSTAFRIMTTACIPDGKEVDLREFNQGAQYAIRSSVSHVFSPSMMEYVINGTEPCDASDYLKHTCSESLYKELRGFCERNAKTNDGLVTTKDVLKCSIVEGSFISEDDGSESIQFVVHCSLPYTKQLFVSEDTNDLEQQIVAATTNHATEEKVPLPNPVTKEGVFGVRASFKSQLPSSGELNWTLDALRIQGKIKNR